MHEAQKLQTAAENADPAKLDDGPKLFFTSAKLGGIGTSAHGDMVVTPVSEIFDYLARRVVKRWEWEERMAPQVDATEDEDDGMTQLRARRASKLTVKLTEAWNGITFRRGCCSI